MFLIDRLVNQSGIRQVEAREKFIFSLSLLIICLLSRNFWVPLTVLFVITWFLRHDGGISFRVWGKLLTLPLVFLLMGVMPILLQVGREVGLPGEGVPVFHLGGVVFYYTPSAVVESWVLMLRSLGCVASLYFLLLTTPMAQLYQLLNWLRVPELLQEMFILVYRYIFLLLETGHRIYQSQSCRGGYQSWGKSMASFAQLLAQVLIKGQVRATVSYRALEVRGYQGKIQVVSKDGLAEASCKESFILSILLVLVVFGVTR